MFLIVVNLSQVTIVVNLLEIRIIIVIAIEPLV